LLPEKDYLTVVVFEKETSLVVVSIGRIRPKFVVHLNGDLTHVVLNASALNAGVKVIADLVSHFLPRRKTRKTRLVPACPG